MRPRSPPTKPLGGGVRDGDPAVAVDAENAGRDAREDRLDEGAPLLVQRIGLDEAALLTQQFRRHLVEGLAEMAEVPVGGPGRHLNVEIAGGDLVGGANQPADRADEPVGPSEAQPDRREQHRQRQHDEHRGEAELEAVPVGLEASPHMRNAGGVFARPWPPAGRSRARRRGIGRRRRGSAECRRKCCRPRESRRARSPLSGVLEIGRVRPGDQLLVRAVGDLHRRSVALHQRGGRETERLRARAEVILELRRGRSEAAGRCGRCRRPSARRRAAAPGTGIRGRAESPGWTR